MIHPRGPQTQHEPGRTRRAESHTPSFGSRAFHARHLRAEHHLPAAIDPVFLHSFTTFRIASITSCGASSWM